MTQVHLDFFDKQVSGDEVPGTVLGLMTLRHSVSVDIGRLLE